MPPIRAALVLVALLASATAGAQPTPVMTVNDITVVEGDAGVSMALFTVTLSNASALTVSARFATADASASAGADYTATSGTVTFAPGDTLATVQVPIVGDEAFEPAETFQLNLSDAVNAAMGDAQGIATIANDDPRPTYVLAEGATGTFFDLDIAIANPTASDAPFTIRYLKEDGSTVDDARTLPGLTRTTIRVDTIAGLAETAVSTVVTSTNGVPLLVERTMLWDARYYGSHTGSAVARARTRWLFGEGSQGFFQTYLLIANAGAAAATVAVQFLREGDTPVDRTYVVQPTSRLTVYAGGIPDLADRSFAMVVTSDEPVIAERAMYFGTPLFNGGHESAGVREPSTSWFHAEGATGPFFDTYLLVGNPNATPATVTFSYLLDSGTPVNKVHVVPANSRLTVNVESEDPQLRNAAFSTAISASLPIIAERAMYWPGSFSSWQEAHNSFGLTAAGARWGLAEGRVGKPPGTPQALQPDFQTFILLANPNDGAARVRVTYLRTTGAPLVKTYDVPPTSRFNVWVNVEVPELVDECFGAVIESLDGLPIAVERAMYNSSGGLAFAAGTNATAIRLP